MLTRVLMLSAGVGAGHVRAADALAQAFTESGAVPEVRHVDALAYASALYRNLYARASSYMVHRMPAAASWLYDALDRPWRNERARDALDRLNTQPLVKLLEEYQPQLAVCTHFLPAAILSSLREQNPRSPRYATVVTDLDVHALWLSRHCGHYFVAMDEARARLTGLGVAAEAITVTGIPIDPAFSRPKDTAAIRRKHGLRDGLSTILIPARRLRLEPLEHILNAMSSLRRHAQVIVLCGSNADLARRVEQHTSRQPADAMVTFTIAADGAMDELMAVSEIMIGRPGGLITAEALASGLALIVVNPIPGQEERNADHLLEEGAAIRCNDLSILGWKVERLLDDTGRLETMKQHAARLARPGAAGDIVRTLLCLEEHRPT